MIEVALLSIIELFEQPFDNMQIDPKSITFQNGRNRELITLVNRSPNRQIFKVKVTNMQLFNIQPGRGYIQPDETLGITVTLKQEGRFSAKLMIQYAAVPGEEEVGWSQIDKACIRDQCIPLSSGKEPPKQQERQETRQHHEKSSVHTVKQSRPGVGETFFKKTQSPLYQSEGPMEGSKSSNSAKNVEEPSLSRQTKNVARQIASRHSMGTIYQSIRQSTVNLRSQTGLRPPIVHRLEQLQKELKNERKNNAELRGQLTNRDHKLNHYRTIEQKKVNSSLTEEEGRFEIGHLNVILLAIICLIFGFLIARSGPSTTL